MFSTRLVNNMALHLVTGYRGSAHITSADQGVFNAACIGSGEYVLATGRMFEAQVVTTNAVRIFDGDALMQGRHVNLANGTFLDVIISAGLQSMNRNDLIVLRYSKDVTSGIESVQFTVIQGALYEGTAIDPSYTKGDILAGATLHEMPLYRVKMSGLNIVGVEPLFEVMAPLSDVGKRRNLLLNGDFNCNTRGLTEYEEDSTVGYSLDMWRIHNILLNKLADGIKITGTSSTATGYFTQFVKVDKLADKYTVSAMVDGELCTFTTTVSTVVAERQFDKFKVTMLYSSNLGCIKVNICPNGKNSITIGYIDLFEGSIPYPHIKEDVVSATLRCSQYIQRIVEVYPIVYSYPGSDSTQASYVFEVPIHRFVSAPDFTSTSYQWQDEGGGVVAGSSADLVKQDAYSSQHVCRFRTPTRKKKHTDCYGIRLSGVLSCEHAPEGD